MIKEERMKGEEEQGQMNDRGIENLRVYAPASASTLLSFATSCGRDSPRQQMVLLIVMEVCAASETSWF